MVQLIAESVGLAARCMTNTLEFFHAVDEWHPTHIAVDLVMPEMDGVEVLVKLADRKCRAKIIITSGIGTRVLDAAGRSANEHGLNISGVLSKPFSPRTLRALLVGAPANDDKRDNASLYTQAPSASSYSSESIAGELRHALAKRELTLVFQPQIHCSTGAIAGFEALVRWSHPKRGTIMPDQFISCAESARIGFYHCKAEETGRTKGSRCLRPRRGFVRGRFSVQRRKQRSLFLYRQARGRGWDRRVGRDGRGHLRANSRRGRSSPPQCRTRTAGNRANRPVGSGEPFDWPAR